MEFIEVTGKTVKEAISVGLSQLSEEGKELINEEIVEEPSDGFLGIIGKKPARVRLYFKPGANHDNDTVLTVDAKDVETNEHVGEDDEHVDKEKVQEIATKGKEFLVAMFKKMDLPVVIEKMISTDRITFHVRGEHLGILIGKHGQTLDAIQYLTNLIANKGEVKRCHIMVDVEDYRVRREQTLRELAERLANKAKRNRQKVVLEPMNSYERKIIHMALQEWPNISTDSEGEGSYRHVVIEYVK